MKMVKSLLLGSAAGLVAIAGAQAADLPVKAKPVQYVKICSLYGAGFYYIPGTDTCIKIGGYVRAEINHNMGGSYATPAYLGLDNRNAFNQDWRVRAGITVDTRSQTAYGTLRSYMFISMTDDNSGMNSGTPTPANLSSGATAYNRLFAPTGFIQFAGFTAGKTESFFAFDTNPYSNGSMFWQHSSGGNGVQLFAYTAQFGNGLSASISLEDPNSQRMGVYGNFGANRGIVAAPGAAIPLNAIAAGTNSLSYANNGWPDVVANLRIDQAWGSAQIMGQLHQVRATDYFNDPAGNHPSDKTGYAIGAGLKINLPMLGKGDYIQGGVTYGRGVMDIGGENGAPLVAVSNNYPITSIAFAPMWDAVAVGATAATSSLSLTRMWSFTLGYEHIWNPQWKTSLYGQYGKVDYSAAAGAVLAGNTGAIVGSTNADWSLWSIGSRTVWTPVQNLDLSLEVMYQKLNTAFDGGIAVLSAATPVADIRDRGWWSGIFRVQRNFWP